MEIAAIIDWVVRVVAVTMTGFCVFVGGIVFQRAFSYMTSKEREISISTQMRDMPYNGNSTFPSERISDITKHDTASLPLDDVRTFIRLKPSLRYDNQAYPIQKKNFFIGRGSDCDIDIEDSYVSSVHCVIQYQDKQFFLWNHGTNGTWLNGKEVVKPMRLRNNDQIQILGTESAKSLFSLQSNDSPRLRLDKMNLMEDTSIPRYTIQFQVQEQ